MKKGGRVKCKAKSQSKLTVAELKQELQRRGLPVRGRKAELVETLEAAIAAEELAASADGTAHSGGQFSTLDDGAPGEGEAAGKRVHVHWGGSSWDEKVSQAQAEPDLSEAVRVLEGLVGATQAESKKVVEITHNQLLTRCAHRSRNATVGGKLHWGM